MFEYKFVLSDGSVISVVAHSFVESVEFLTAHLSFTLPRYELPIIIAGMCAGSSDKVELEVIF